MDASSNIEVGKWSGLDTPLVTADDNGNSIDWAAVGLNAGLATAALALLEVFSCDTDETYANWTMGELAIQGAPYYLIEPSL